jgi:RimJ/RimL family protein N-acetyltransferase
VIHADSEPITVNDIFKTGLILQSDRIILHPIKPEDYYAFETITEDKSMWDYFTNDLSIKAELKSWIETAVHDLNHGSRLPFTILDKSSYLIIGSTSIGNVSIRDKRAEIGWTWICKSHQGKGVNDEIKYLMIKYILETANFNRVEFKTDVLNLPARKALLRMGATEEGILRSHTLMAHGRRRDTFYYSILKSEWNEIKLKNSWQ